jgi:formylglycine-generating enzyme required for sulfatase activity
LNPNFFLVPGAVTVARALRARLIGRLLLTALVSTCVAGAAPVAELPESFVASNGLRMVLIRGGSFLMGNERATDAATLGQQKAVFTHGGEDERPVHHVTLTHDFYISETEVTAHQFVKYQEDHVDAGYFSPYATGVSWEDATGFAAWLTRAEDGTYQDESDQAARRTVESDRPRGEGWVYRLPTEAEWEYVARAGSSDHFSSGALPPASGEPNVWGVKNMHTDAIEWVHDWHDDYAGEDETDPVGPVTGLARGVRGGGLNMPYHELLEKYPVDGRMPFYRRSANRSSAPPQWRGRHNIGFRLVYAPMPASTPRAPAPRLHRQFVRQQNPWVDEGPDPRRPWYVRREVLPIPLDNAPNPAIRASGLHPTMHGKNHNPALLVAPNGDLIATYFSASIPDYEDLTDVLIIGTRLRFGAEQWDLPAPFFDFAGAKDIGPVLTRQGDRLWFAAGGGGMDGIVFRWQTSDDNGATWGPVQLPVITGRRGDNFPQPVSNLLFGPDGTIMMPTDGSGANSFLWVSHDGGTTWSDPGGRTNGRHTVFVHRRDGAILGLGGKASHIDGYMPQSVSHDGGRTWEVSKTIFPWQGPSQQKPSLIRLASGRLFFASDWLNAAGEQPPGLNRTGAFVALSDDDGETWTIKDLPDLPPHVRWLFRDKAGYRPSVLKDGTLAYSIAAQAPSGVIHLLNSATYPVLHFELNEAWILDPAAGATPRPATAAQAAPRTTRETHADGAPKAEWGVQNDGSGRPRLHGPETHWHANGRKEYEVTWSNGRKTGLETHWDGAGRKVWQWDHRADGTSVWTQFHANGAKRHESTWRNQRCDGLAREWDRTGRLVQEHLFRNGILTP